MSKFDWPELRKLQPLPPGRENATGPHGATAGGGGKPQPGVVTLGMKEGSKGSTKKGASKGGNGKLSTGLAGKSQQQKGPVVPEKQYATTNPRNNNAINATKQNEGRDVHASIGAIEIPPMHVSTSSGVPPPGTQRLGTSPPMTEDSKPYTSRQITGEGAAAPKSPRSGVAQLSLTGLGAGLSTENVPVGKSHSRPGSGGSKRYSVGQIVKGPTQTNGQPRTSKGQSNQQRHAGPTHAVNPGALQWTFVQSNSNGAGSGNTAGGGAGTSGFTGPTQTASLMVTNHQHAFNVASSLDSVILQPGVQYHTPANNGPAQVQSQNNSPRPTGGILVQGSGKSKTKFSSRLPGTNTVSVANARFQSNLPAQMNPQTVDVGYALRELGMAKRRLEEARRLVVVAGRGAFARLVEDSARPKDFEITSDFASQIQAFMRGRRSVLQMRRREAIMHLNQLTQQDPIPPSPLILQTKISSHIVPTKDGTLFPRPIPAPLDRAALASQQNRAHPVPARMTTPLGNPIPSNAPTMLHQQHQQSEWKAPSISNTSIDDTPPLGPRQNNSSVMEELIMSGVSQGSRSQKRDTDTSNSDAYVDSVTVRQLKQLYFDFYDAEAWSLADMATPMLGHRMNTNSSLTDMPPIPEDLVSEGSPSPQKQDQARETGVASGGSVGLGGANTARGPGQQLKKFHLPYAYSAEEIEENIETSFTPRTNDGGAGFSSLSSHQHDGRSKPAAAAVGGLVFLPRPSPLSAADHDHQRMSVVSDDDVGMVEEETVE